MHHAELPTPALTIDLDVVERNLDRMATYCRSHSIGLRPHTKTHKTPEVARMQLDRGACGLTVAKVGEAEVMAAAALDDILVAYPVFGNQNLARLASLAVSRRLLMALDSEVTAQALSRACAAAKSTIGVLVEYDCGLGRSGLSSVPECVALALQVERLPGLRFRGLMTYFGQVRGNEQERQDRVKSLVPAVTQALEAFHRAGIPLEIVSGGSTPSAPFAHEVPGLTEIRPGTYCYNDLNDYYQGFCRLEDCAARVVTTVVSSPARGRAIIDAGSKTLSSDLLGTGPSPGGGSDNLIGSRTGYGLLLEAPEVVIHKLNEEHGLLDTSKLERRLQVGEVLTLIPNHVCTCVNMHDEVFLLRSGEVIGTWRVAARGKVR